MDKVAVVILNYNGRSLLERFLTQVRTHSHPYKVIIIDNASTDDSLDYLNHHHPDLQVIALDQNYGFSGGYNRGLKQVQAEYYILLNSDVEVTAHWIEPLLDYMEQNPNTGICQPKICSLQDRGKFDYAGAAGGYLDGLGYPFCRGRLFHTIEEDLGQYNDTCAIFWAGGACILVRSQVYEHLHGFDEDFFAHMEEIDLCWRAGSAGFEVAYVGTSTVYHLGGGTLHSTSTFKTFLNFRNGITMLLKNLPFTQWWKLPIRLFLDGVALLRFLFNGQWTHAWAVVKAEASFLWTIPKTLSKRTSANAPMKLYNKVIVWEYFVRGRRTFGELTSGA